MLKRLFVAAILFAPLLTFARDEASEAAAIRDHEICQTLLRDRMVFKEYENPGRFAFDLKQGLTPRNFLGSFPARNEITEKVVAEQGGHWWGTQIAIKKSIEEARAHDADYTDSMKIAYLISDVDVSHFQVEDSDHPGSGTPHAEVVAALKKALATAPLIEFEDKFDAKGNKLAAESKVIEINNDFFSRIVDLESVVWLNADTRGPRFSFKGWTVPRQRGVVDYNDLFKLNDKGIIADKDIRAALRKLIKFVQDGGRIVYNENFVEALEMAKNQLRKDSDGKMVRQSRYMTDPSTMKSAMDSHHQGRAYSVEARDRNGRLLAGNISFRNGNLIKGDTVFYLTREENSDGQGGEGVNYSYLARALGLAEAMRLHRMGIDIQDVGMVTHFTAQGGGKLIPGEEFAAFAKAMARQPEIDLRLDKPFSLEELPYPLAEISKWLP